MKKILKQLQKGAFGEQREYASLDKTCKNTDTGATQQRLIKCFETVNPYPTYLPLTSTKNT